MSQKPATVLELLTMEELETLESLTGKEYVEIFSGKGMSAKETRCLHWILSKRANPNAKMEDSKNLTIVDMGKFLQEFLADPKAS
jgi:hypothetical protein